MSPATLDRDFVDTTSVAVTEIVPDRWQKVRNYDPAFAEYVAGQIARLRGFAPGWDSRRAPALDTRVLDAAERLLMEMEPHITTRPLIVPLVNGAVQIEWHDGPKLLELEFEGPETIHYLKWHPDTGVEDEAFARVADRDAVRALLSWFSQAS